MLDLDALLDTARTGHPQSEERLFRHLSARFRLFAQRHIGNGDDAEEVVQDALLTVLARYKKMKFERSFAAWAHQVLRNTVGTYYRKRARYSRREREWLDDNLRSTGWTPDPLVEQTLLDCLKKLSRINRRYARILNFHYQGFTVTEIGRRLELSRNNLYSVLSRARRLLRVCLEKGELAP